MNPRNLTIAGTIVVALVGGAFVASLGDQQVDISIPFNPRWEQSEGVRILVHEPSNNVVPDFQLHAREGTLTANAVRAGFGVEGEFREVFVSRDRYESLVETYKEKLAPLKEQEEADRRATRQEAIDKALQVLTKEELERVENAILDGYRFNDNPTR